MPGTVRGELLKLAGYKFSVDVSDERGNGTDGDLSVALEGERGTCQEHEVGGAFLRIHSHI